MSKITIFMRNGGVWISTTNEANTALSIGQRMVAGGFITCQDGFWGKPRELVVNLADAKTVILEKIEAA